MTPTANPQTTLPSNSVACSGAAAISIQPSTSGRVEAWSVRRRPMASIMGPDNTDPSGVAAEWMLAGKKNWF